MFVRVLDFGDLAVFVGVLDFGDFGVIVGVLDFGDFSVDFGVLDIDDFAVNFELFAFGDFVVNFGLFAFDDVSVSFGDLPFGDFVLKLEIVCGSLANSSCDFAVLGDFAVNFDCPFADFRGPEGILGDFTDFKEALGVLCVCFVVDLPGAL